MTNEQLVRRIQSGENVAENMKQLYEQVKAFIHITAARYRDSGMMEDLEQEGYLALYPAIDGYDPARGVKFLTYADKWIRQRMQRYLQINGSAVRLSVGREGLVRKYQRVCDQFQQVRGREATARELSSILGLTLDEVEQLQLDAGRCNTIPLETPTSGADGQIGTVGDLVASAEDLEAEVLERMEQERLAAALWECVEDLPEDQAEVLRRRYRLEQQLKDIAAVMEIEHSEVTRLHRKALSTLRKPETRWKLKGCLPEYLQAELYHGGVGAFQRTWTSSTERAALKLWSTNGR